VISDDGNSLIEKRYIKQFKEAPYYKPDLLCAPSFVLVLIDPNNGGGNEMAIMAMTQITGRKVVCIR
jgi:hypothetical protein